jgi:hypothetical protein
MRVTRFRPLTEDTISHHIRSTVRPTVADTLARYGLKKAMRVIGHQPARR